MKHLLLTTIAAVVLVGCGESQQSVPPESKPVEPVAEAAQPEPPTAKAPDISIHDAANTGNIEAVKQHLAANADVNVKGIGGMTPLHRAAREGHKEVSELLITNSADVNAKDKTGRTPLHRAAREGHKEVAELLIAKDADVNAKSESGLFKGEGAGIAKG
jgi:ankyrin repeat protein